MYSQSVLICAFPELMKWKHLCMLPLQNSSMVWSKTRKKQWMIMHPAVRETIWFRNVQNQQRRSSDGARKEKEMVKKQFLLVEINFTKKLQTFVSSQCISLATRCNMYISYALKQFKSQYIFHLDYQTICPLCKPFIKYPQLKYEMKCMTWRILILSFFHSVQKTKTVPLLCKHLLKLTIKVKTNF